MCVRTSNSRGGVPRVPSFLFKPHEFADQAVPSYIYTSINSYTPRSNHSLCRVMIRLVRVPSCFTGRFRFSAGAARMTTTTCLYLVTIKHNALYLLSFILPINYYFPLFLFLQNIPSILEIKISNLLNLYDLYPLIAKRITC